MKIKFLIIPLLLSVISPSIFATEILEECSGKPRKVLDALIEATGALKCTKCSGSDGAAAWFNTVRGSCFWKVGKGYVQGSFSSNVNDPTMDGLETTDQFKSYIEAGGFFTESKQYMSDGGGKKLYDYQVITGTCEVNPEFEVMPYIRFDASTHNHQDVPFSHLVSKTKSIYRSFVSSGICVPFDEAEINFTEFDKKYGLGDAGVSDAVDSEDDQELGACYNYRKDGKEEGIDCGGDCDECKTRIQLDKEEFVGNFNGKDSIVISGRVVKRHHHKEEKNPGIANAQVTAQGWGRGAAAKIKSQSITTDKNGKFKFKITLPKYDKRDKLKGKKVGIRVSSKHKHEYVLVNQTQSAPQIINFKKRTEKPMGDNSWGTFTLEVIDAEEDVKNIEIYAPAGMLQWKKTNQGSKDSFKPVRLETKYSKDGYQFGWYAPPMSINFDVSFWQKQRAAFIGSDTAAIGATKTVSDELLRFGGEKIDKAAENMTNIIQNYQNQGFLLSPEKLKEMKNVKSIRYGKALGILGRVTNGVKFVTEAKKTVKTMAEHTRVIVQEAETGSEGMVRGMLVAMEGIGMVEAGASAFLPSSMQDNFVVKGGKAVKDMTIGVMMKGLKGSLEYAADTFVAGRAKARTRRFPIIAIAVDKAGHRSEPVTLLVDVIHYSSKPE